MNPNVTGTKVTKSYSPAEVVEGSGIFPTTNRSSVVWQFQNWKCRRTTPRGGSVAFGSNSPFHFVLKYTYTGNCNAEAEEKINAVFPLLRHPRIERNGVKLTRATENVN